MLSCKITSSEKTSEYKNLTSIDLPSVSGQMQVFAGHARSFVALDKGKIVMLLANKEKISLDIDPGICLISKNTVTVVL